MKNKTHLIRIITLSTALSLTIGLVAFDHTTPVKVEAATHEDNYDLYTYTGTYYDTIDFDGTGGMNGALRSSIATLVRPAGFYTYGSSGETHLSTQLQYADEDPNNSNNMIMFYTRNSITKTAATVNNVIKWNREHVWCQSLSNDNWGTSEAGTDILHLRPTYESTNKSRGNDVYGDNHKSGPKYYNDMLYGYMGGTYFEPIDSVKGDVARIIMYLWTTYTGYKSYNSLNILDIFQSYDVLLKWHTKDKPDVMEGNRNNYSQSSKQKNRNPFVDHPELGWKIFGDQASTSVKNACMAAYPADGGDPVEPTGISLNKSTASIEAGRTLQLNAILEPNGATGSISWSSNNDSVASVNSSGLVTAAAAGNATITATCGGYSASCNITVTAAVNNYGTLQNPLSVNDAIELINRNGGNETASPLYVKGVVSSNTAYSDQYSNYSAVWLEDDDGTASSFELYRVQLDGSVQGDYSAANSLVGKEVVAYGYGKIYNTTPELTTSSKTPTYPIILSVSAPEATSIELNQTTADLEVGDTLVLSATLIPNTAESNVIWESSNESVATVNNSGLVTAIANGQSIITARVENSDVEAECIVTVTGGAVISASLELASSISVGDIVYLGCSYTSAQYYGPSGTTQDAFGTYVFYDGEPDANTYPLEVCEGNSEGTYALKITTGTYINKYLAYSGSKNSLKVTSTLDDASSWTISFDGSNNATITNVADTTRVIWWNLSSPRFACYVDKADGNSFKYVQLWKEGTPAEPEVTDYLTGATSKATIHATVESAPGQSQTASKTIAQIVGTPAPANGTEQLESLVLDGNITASVNTDGNNGKIYNNGTEWRLYQTNSAVVTITASNGALINSVTLTFSASDNGVMKYSGNNITSGSPVSIASLSSAAFTVGASSGSKGKIQVTAISVTYVTAGTTTVSDVSMRFGLNISKTNWDAINDNENWEITDYGVMLCKKTTLTNAYNTSSISEAYTNGETLYIANKGSGVAPHLEDNTYSFMVQLNVTRESNYPTVYVAAPFIKVNETYYFLTEMEYSVNTLAAYYLSHSGSDLSTAALNILAGN